MKLEDNKQLVIGLIILLILLVDYCLILRPQLGLVFKMNRKNSTLSKNLKLAKQDIAAIEQFKKKLALLKEKGVLTNERISPEEEIPLILENISQNAKQANLKITQLRPSREEEKMVASNQEGKIYRLPILIEAHCGYHQLGSFINKLENGKIFISIAGLDISPNPDDSLHHNAKLVAETYFLKK